MMEQTDAEWGKIDDFVVKFPGRSRDPYTDNVHKEYDILKRLSHSVSVAKPIHRSNDKEEKAVGAPFIVMSYVQGTVYEDVGQITPGQLSLALESVMKTLVDLHAIHWHPMHDATQYLPFDRTQSFWEDEVTTWTNNYKKTMWWWQRMWGSFPESSLYSDMQKAGKPTSGHVCCIHRSLAISNFVFGDNMEVKAMLNFKYDNNGDFLMDIASMLMAFQKTGDYSVSRLTVDDEGGRMEERAKAVYCERSRRNIPENDLYYAKAVCCLRDIYRIKNASNGGFKGSELGRYKEVTSDAQKHIDILHDCGRQCLRQSSVKQ